jgi:hypothetical protein
VRRYNKALPDGAYTFSVRCSVDAGSAAAVPAALRFDVDSQAPGAFIRDNTAAVNIDTAAAVYLSDGDALRVHFDARRDLLAEGKVFECRLSLLASAPHQSVAAAAAATGVWSSSCVSPYLHSAPPEGQGRVFVA